MNITGKKSSRNLTALVTLTPTKRIFDFLATGSKRTRDNLLLTKGDVTKIDCDFTHTKD